MPCLSQRDPLYCEELGSLSNLHQMGYKRPWTWTVFWWTWDFPLFPKVIPGLLWFLSLCPNPTEGSEKFCL